MKVLRKECIGRTYNGKAPNGIPMRVVIEDNPTKYKLYELLGFDVFVNIEAKPLKPIEKDPNKMSWTELKKFAKDKGIEGKTKKEILDGFNSVDKE